VDLDALLANAEHLRRAAGPAAALLPMVKADAYGLGMEAVAKVLAAAFPGPALAGFGVAAVAEGEALRRAGWRHRIVLVAPAPPAEFERAADADLVLGVSDLAAVQRWARLAEARGRRLPMHVEIDTGMGRAGFPADRVSEWAPEVARIAARWVRWEGTFSHFHSADEPDLAPTHRQWDRFSTALAAIAATPAAPPAAVVHVANSAAALRCRFRCEWVRPGIFLYGGRVGGEPPKPVVSVRARIALIREVPAGTSLGYGATYMSRRAERWGTLAIGYGDGVRRALGPAGGYALVRRRRVPIVGRVSMDMTVVDLTDVPEAEAGDVATLIGRDGADEITVDQVADRVGTISYEILTGLAPRLPRVYVGAAAAAVHDPWVPGGPA
jgi:alanine racemase